VEVIGVRLRVVLRGQQDAEQPARVDRLLDAEQQLVALAVVAADDRLAAAERVLKNLARIAAG